MSNSAAATPHPHLFSFADDGDSVFGILISFPHDDDV
jgi:hypothetical protein